MKRFQLFALSSLLFVVHGQAGDPPSAAEIYQEEASALAEALEAFNEDPASDEHPIISNLAEALLEMLTADEACYTTRHAEIERVAQKLLSLTTDLSFPCLDEPAYDAARGIASAVGPLRKKAKFNAALAASPIAVGADKEALASKDPPMCSVEIGAFMGENIYDDPWLRRSEWGTMRASRFDNFLVGADGKPEGGTYEWNARELGGKAISGEAVTIFFGIPIDFPTGPILNQLIYFNMQGTSAGGFYVIEVDVIYHAPNGTTCSDTGSIVIPPR